MFLLLRTNMRLHGKQQPGGGRGERQEPLLQVGEVAVANAGEWRWAAGSRGPRWLEGD